MSLIELFIIAIGLSMDAFAVAICKGLALKSINIKKAGIVGLYFGIFQAGMPLIGYIVGAQFQDKITAFDHWIAFILLGIIGFNMIKESLSKECEEEAGSEICENAKSLNFRNMSVLAIATSIDALAVGVSFAFLKIDIIPAVSFIGIITFTLSIIGVKIGNIFGVKYKSKAELTGGIILIFMGLKILLEHTNFIFQ
ncbi:manganese efflux pump [Lachnospiraceae bacterium MD1]|jgi:putative Mn2+ efflux pump MntP|uniref:Putative manganese efflux pump MntP n=1 Tax=Variimorphobacter saccharofermentans TaxID=2755051 RepID=A0A839JZS8_9FIRM|nr:manganese efflux pump MntP family protein [Variimorphobacter saccharofermentans]MBB2182688.1 manganese efflux pump [Variimorphobacter saccharofermentans]